VGRLDTLESVIVDWPDGKSSIVSPVATNQRLTIRQTDARGKAPSRPPPAQPPLFRDVSSQVGLDFVHQENNFVDFDRERLIPKLVSTEGPFVTVGDVNGDGLDDFFIGGAKDHASALYIQRRDGRSPARIKPCSSRIACSEDLGAAFFDDYLYVVTAATNSPAPRRHSKTGCIRATAAATSVSSPERCRRRG